MAQENISAQLNDLLASRDFSAELLDAEGRPSDPENAEVFTFDYVSSAGTNYGTMVIVLGEDNEMQVFYGDNLGRSMEGDDKSEFFDFVQHLHKFANMRRWTYSPKNINQVKYTMQGLAAIKEGLFEGYYGTRRVSYSGEPTEARLVIQHSRPLGEGDARFRAIESIFIETADSERFRLQFKNLAGARAMLEHVRQGGRPYDIRGNHITEMVAEIGVLSRFNRAAKNRVLEGITAELVTEAQLHYATLRDNLKHLASARGYQSYFESWSPADITLQEELVDSIKTMFVEQTLDSRIEAALPVLARLQQAGTMKEADIFESWAERLTEGTWALPETPEQQEKLQQLMSQELIVGPDATNATEQLYDLVGDDVLFDRLSELAQRDARANIWADTEVQARLAELGIQTPATGEPTVAPDEANTEPELSEAGDAPAYKRIDRAYKKLTGRTLDQAAAEHQRTIDRLEKQKAEWDEYMKSRYPDKKSVSEGWGTDDVTGYANGYTLWTRTQSGQPGEPRYWLYRTPAELRGRDDRVIAAAIRGQEPVAKFGSAEEAFIAMKKLSQQGVTESVKIVDQDSDLDQQVFTLNVDGETVSFTYWDYENNFQNPDIKDIYQQAQEQLGKKLSPEQIKAVARSVFKSFKSGVAEETIHVGHRNSKGDWIKTSTHSNFADAKKAMADLEKQGKKGVQHRYDNKGSIDPGTHNFRKVDEQGVAEGSKTRTCPTCDGSGEDTLHRDRPCQRCNGKGHIPINKEQGVAEGSGKNVVKSIKVGNFRHDLVDTGMGWQVRIYNGDELYDTGLSKNSEQKGLAALEDAVAYTENQTRTKRQGVAESDPSGLLSAAKTMNRSFIITADLAEGGRKRYRVRAQSERVAREKFAQHANQAKIVSVREEGTESTVAGSIAPVVGEGSKDDPMNYNAAITSSYYETKEDPLARIKNLALNKTHK